MSKAWVAGGIALAVPFGLVGLLTVGVGAMQSASGSQTGGTTMELAAGTVPAQFQPAIDKWGRLCPEISPALLAAQLYQESGFDPNALSPIGAQGIAQFMPGTWPEWATDGDGDGKTSPWDPDDAIPAAARYDCSLAKYVAKVPGDRTNNMLAAYNAGAYRVMQYNGIPPYKETQNYVKAIRSLEQSFGVVKAPLQPMALAAGAVNWAQTKLGTPYLWGGEGSAADGGRFDCSGLTQAAYETVGIKLPRVANDQWNAGRHPSRDQLLPGDLVFFATDLRDPRSIHHVGMYVGNGQMIHAPYTGTVIKFGPIDKPDYIGATRVTPEGAQSLPDRSPGSANNDSGAGSPLAEPDKAAAAKSPAAKSAVPGTAPQPRLPAGTKPRGAGSGSVRRG
ncbi:NlpC/P60 family protein [Embleya sp. NBC_00896]|uniref:bifunctional lytic transglycosylase/C40 family peptidase n=1 Tax=Embleya sp. NBC_00896 TaxID=2975961 RepID=UPI003864D637|nr:bifunctional lytic transglycosylase/C40 family peptidase [Embleya sp. NBC_00896]